MRTRAAGLSDVGRCRETNQDHFLVEATLGVYAVADGMGGHAAGEVASRLAIDTLVASLRASDGDGEAASTVAAAAERLRGSLIESNHKICESMLSRDEWRGMGTTIVALLRADDRVVIGHVGDSRAYLLRDGVLHRLTSDHSWVNEQVKLGLLTDEEAQRHPMRNIVTRAMGNNPQVQVEVSDQEARPGDVFLLCSDGLNSMIGDEQIRAALARHRETPQAACRELVDLANAQGGEDNITVVVLARLNAETP